MTRSGNTYTRRPHARALYKERLAAAITRRTEAFRAVDITRALDIPEAVGQQCLNELVDEGLLTLSRDVTERGHPYLYKPVRQQRQEVA